jgi:hypothetical protein
VKRGEDEEKQGKRDDGEAEAWAGAGGGSAWPAWVGGRRRGVATAPTVPPPRRHFSGGRGGQDSELRWVSATMWFKVGLPRDAFCAVRWLPRDSRKWPKPTAPTDRLLAQLPPSSSLDTKP